MSCAFAIYQQRCSMARNSYLGHLSWKVFHEDFFCLYVKAIASIRTTVLLRSFGSTISIHVACSKSESYRYVRSDIKVIKNCFKLITFFSSVTVVVVDAVARVPPGSHISPFLFLFYIFDFISPFKGFIIC